jgi:hypothetical protein
MSELAQAVPPASDDWGGFDDEDLALATLEAEAAGLREDDEHEAAAWLAGLPDDVRAGFEAGPRPGEYEALAAGFWHHDDGPPGAGFAAGGAMDTLPGGPLLALFTATATDLGEGGHAALGESELIGVLCAWRRLSSWAAAGEADAITALTTRRATQARERNAPTLAEHAGDEVAAALTLTSRSATLLMADARGLETMPAVHELLATGQIDLPRARVFTGELGWLSPADARQIADQILPDAPRMTTSQLRRALHRAVLAFDPGAAEARKKTAAQDADVTIWTEASGNAALAARELDEADALAAHRRITAIARWLRQQGAPGTIGQLRAAACIAVLLGRAPADLLPHDPAARTGDAGAETAGGGAQAHSEHGPSTHAGPDDDGRRAGRTGTGIDPDSPLATSAGPPVAGTIHLTMPLSAWTGQSQTPGEIAGYGPAPASTCRDLAAKLSQHPDTRYCLTLTAPDGQPLAHACAPRHGPGPPPSSAARAWATALAGQADYFETGACAHPRQERHYRPSRHLNHLMAIRTPHCTQPGCAQPAHRCDLDHTVAYHRGGRTCECNLGPLCRHSQQVKQTPGWHLDQSTPGTYTWTLPSGRAYTTSPYRYPV